MGRTVVKLLVKKRTTAQRKNRGDGKFVEGITKMNINEKGNPFTKILDVVGPQEGEL